MATHIWPHALPNYQPLRPHMQYFFIVYRKLGIFSCLKHLPKRFSCLTNFCEMELPTRNIYPLRFTAEIVCEMNFYRFAPRKYFDHEYLQIDSTWEATLLNT